MANQFSNDGSFFEQFLKQGGAPEQQHAQNEAQPQEAPTEQQQQNPADYYGQGYAGQYYGYAGQAYAGQGYPAYTNPAYAFPPLPPRGGQSYYGPGAGYGAQAGAPAAARTQDDKNTPSRSLWLGNVHPDTTEHELRSEFQDYGPIENIKVPPSLLLPPKGGGQS